MSSTKQMIAAVVDDDSNIVRRLLQMDASLASWTFPAAKLYEKGIFHWIYVGDSLLHLAAAGYRVEIVQLLLRSGADPNGTGNHRHSSPLHYAADGFITGVAWDAKVQVETIRCLLQYAADIHAQDLNGATPLHRSVRTRCAAAVRFLLEAGSDPMIKNKSGSTPFHLAVQNTGRGGAGAPAALSAQQEIIQAFLSFGVSPNVKNNQGKTVADSARSSWVRGILEGAIAG